MNIRIGIIAVTLVLVPFYVAIAQIENEQEMGQEEFVSNTTSVPAPPNTVSCFDYYQFGSVQANLTASVTGTVSGAPIAFTGQLINSNSYPIVDGALYVKIFKKRGDTNDGNGPDVVDQFFVKGDIAIPAGGSIPVTFQWHVPSHAQSGDYQLATFFTTSRKFNLLGLTFTDDVVGNTVPFAVMGETTTGVKFNKAGVEVNGIPYYFAAFPPHTSATSSVRVEAVVNNTTGDAQVATITWAVYQWDSQLRENLVQEEVRQVNIPTGSSEVSIVVTDTKYPVYLVVGTLKWMDTQSIIGARFVRDGVDRTRINFPGITSFPLVAGEVNTLFSCLHNSGSGSIVSNGSLDITLTDRVGNLIHQYRYDGDVTGGMMGVASQFRPEKTYDYFQLTARLFNKGEFVDEASLVYDCMQIDPNTCIQERQATFWDTIFESIRLIGTLIGGLLLIIAVSWMYRNVSRTSNTTQLPLV